MTHRTIRPRRLARAALAAFLVGGGLVATPLDATAQPADTTPPVWTKLPTTSMALGTTLTTSYDADCFATHISSLRAVVDMKASDPQSGIATYFVGGETISEEFTPGRWEGDVNSWDHACGGGSRNLEFQVFNGAGLRAERAGWNAARLGVLDNSDPAVTYSPGWGTSKCSCWSQGTVHRTTQRGAAATITIPSALTNPAGRNVVAAPYGLGLVMSKGPDRGKADVFLDGVKVATVDTYAATGVNRTVVWRQAVSAGSHTVRVVNLATAGHPRIDLDATVVVQK